MFYIHNQMIRLRSFNKARVAGTKSLQECQQEADKILLQVLWSLDSLIRVSNVGTTDTEFSFDTVSSSCTLLSANAIVQYNSMFYWVGTDNFYMYNGVVNIWQNNMSINYFFGNINFSQRQKVWLTKNKRFSEIWIHYPSKTAKNATAL